MDSCYVNFFVNVCKNVKFLINCFFLINGLKVDK